MRPLILIALAFLSVGCFRPWKRDPLPLPPSQLPDSQPPAPIVPASAQEPNRSAPVTPPHFDIPPGSIPALPGPARPGIPSLIPDSPPLAEPLSNSAEPITAPLARVKPPVEKAAPGPSTVPEVRKLLDAAIKTYAGIPDYEAKLVRREVVSGKLLPTEELNIAHRKEPFSFYMTVTGEAGKGREMLYVKGQNAGKIIIVTGKGDNALLGTGKRMELDPESSLLSGKSRNRITEAGMGKMLATIEKYVGQAESGKRPIETVRHLGSTEGIESKMPLTTVEVTLQTGDEPLLPKGGKRTYGFDADPKSASYGLPVQILTHDDKGKEVEFYSFSGFKLPAKLTDADFSPDRLGGKKK